MKRASNKRSVLIKWGLNFFSEKEFNIERK